MLSVERGSNVGSIRVFLITTVLATMILFNFVAALQGYQSSLEEAERLFDNHLSQVVKLIANLHVEHMASNLNQSSDLAYQLWHNEQLVASSANAPEGVITELKAGFDYANFNGYRWRTLAYYAPDSEHWIVAAERTDLRFVLAEKVIVKAVLPIVLGIPLAGLLVWFIINRGLKPLRSLSHQLKLRQVDDLTAIRIPDLKNELEQVVHSINVLIGRLGSALDREKRFTADAAHELRTPISALKVQLHNIADEVPADSHSYQELKSGIERMQHLVEQLLSLYRFTPEEFASQFERINLYKLAQNVLAEQHYQFEARDQSLELEGSNCFIDGDPFSLSALLQNLLSNANKYTPVAGKVRVSVKCLQGKVWLTVEDNGPGIDPADVGKIFERFHRLHENQDQVFTQGCGLGLTIVKHVAELHRASIDVLPSGFDSGCAFVIKFKKT